MMHLVRIFDGTGHIDYQKTFDRYNRAETWARKQLAKINDVFHNCIIYKYGDSTGGNLVQVEVLDCTRNIVTGKLIIR